MIKGTLEVEECSVAVTANSVVLTVRSVDGKSYTITMPAQMGEQMAVEILTGMEAAGHRK